MSAVKFADVVARATFGPQQHLDDIKPLAKAFLSLRGQVKEIADQLECLCQPINRRCTKHKLYDALDSTK